MFPLEQRLDSGSEPSGSASCCFQPVPASSRHLQLPGQQRNMLPIVAWHAFQSADTPVACCPSSRCVLSKTTRLSFRLAYGNKRTAEPVRQRELGTDARCAMTGLAEGQP